MSAGSFGGALKRIEHQLTTLCTWERFPQQPRLSTWDQMRFGSTVARSPGLVYIWSEPLHTSDALRPVRSLSILSTLCGCSTSRPLLRCLSFAIERIPSRHPISSRYVSVLDCLSHHQLSRKATPV